MFAFLLGHYLRLCKFSLEPKSFGKICWYGILELATEFSGSFQHSPVENFCLYVSLSTHESTSQYDHGIDFVNFARVAMPLLVQQTSKHLLCLAT
jgi:hypothetical protein